MQTVVLWDIDGTLIRGNGGRVSVSAFLSALQLTAELTEQLAYPKEAGGKTDPQIALEMLQAAAIDDALALALMPAFSSAYVANLERERDRLVTDLRVLPGVTQVLTRLQALGTTQALLTGNLVPIARLKLACAELDTYVNFEVGAFGSDHADRTQLVPIVRGRLERHLGITDADIVVVGDTPRDIACARAGGARAIAVATGNYPRVALTAHAPDAVFDDLSDTEAVVAALLRYSNPAHNHSALIV